jgi:hypothetical protein
LLRPIPLPACAPDSLEEVREVEVAELPHALELLRPAGM